MNNQLENVSTTSGNLEGYSEAIRLHQEILIKKDIAGNALLELAKSLKLMRDTKLYEHIGYSNFESYCEEACGFKQRQAYSYISSYEKLGSQFLQSNASLGVTKLELLSSLAPDERETFVEENNVEDMTAKELKETIAKLEDFREQISFLEGENEKLKDNVKEAKLIKAKEFDEKEVEKIKREAATEERKRIEELVLEEKKGFEEQAKSRISDLEADIKKAIEEKEQLKKDMAISSDKNLTMFSFLVEGLQDSFVKIKVLIEGLDADEQTKYRGAVINLCNRLIAEMENRGVAKNA